MSRLSEALRRLEVRGDWKGRGPNPPCESPPDEVIEPNRDEMSGPADHTAAARSLRQIAIAPPPADPVDQLETIQSSVEDLATETTKPEPGVDEPSASANIDFSTSNTKMIDVFGPSDVDSSGVFPRSFVIGDPALPPAPRPEATHFEKFVASELGHAARGEQYRRLWQSIDNDSANSGSRSVLLISMEDDDQRALTACCLAVHACTQTESSLLMVDAAAPTGSLSRKLQLHEHVGLTDVLEERAELREAVYPLSHEKLDFLPLGGFALSDAAEIDKAMTRWANAVRQAWQCVVVDGGVVDSPLATTLTRDCDATYLLLRLGQTTREAAIAAIADLRAAGGRVAGAVVTNAAA
jgi:Mrp family chromosome partitioning ATPase